MSSIQSKLQSILHFWLLLSILDFLSLFQFVRRAKRPPLNHLIWVISSIRKEMLMICSGKPSGKIYLYLLHAFLFGIWSRQESKRSGMIRLGCSDWSCSHILIDQICSYSLLSQLHGTISRLNAGNGNFLFLVVGLLWYVPFLYANILITLHKFRILSGDSYLLIILTVIQDSWVVGKI